MADQEMSIFDRRHERQCPVSARHIQEWDQAVKDTQTMLVARAREQVEFSNVQATVQELKAAVDGSTKKIEAATAKATNWIIGALISAVVMLLGMVCTLGVSILMQNSPARAAADAIQQLTK